MYSMKATTELTGLTAETLRAWERRYGLVAPERDASGRRGYSPQAVERLARLKRLTDRGHAIRHLAALDDAALAALEAHATTVPAAGPAASQDPLLDLRKQLLDAAADYRAADFDRTLGVAMATLPLPQLARELLAPLLTDVGERWASGVFDIAQERLVSSAIRTRALALVNQRQRDGRSALLLATLAGERHELGLLLVALLALASGCPFEYLGADLPALEVARIAQAQRPSVVAVSTVACAVPGLARAELERLREALPAEVAVWVGGAGAALAAAGIDGVQRMDDLVETERRLRALARG